jgi:hypothetical protein
MERASSEVEVTSVEAYHGRFIVYFPDDNYVAFSAHDLAQRFPERTPILPAID